MTNLFALLQEPPRPWLDPDALKERYHRLTATHHPDLGGRDSDFAAVNHAYQTLADPAARLRHLLELEAPAALASAHAVPPEIAAFFTPVANTRQETDAFFKKHAAAASPLARALLTPDQYRLQEQLESLIASLTELQEQLLARLREIDALWDTDHPAALARIPALWQALNYTAKWLAALREPLFKLAAL
jgi:curved DNA-binding protein CbpA